MSIDRLNLVLYEKAKRLEGFSNEELDVLGRWGYLLERLAAGQSPASDRQRIFVKEINGERPVRSISGLVWCRYRILTRPFSIAGSPVGFAQEEIEQLTRVGPLLRALVNEELDPRTDEDRNFIEDHRCGSAHSEWSRLWQKKLELEEVHKAWAIKEAEKQEKKRLAEDAAPPRQLPSGQETEPANEVDVTYKKWKEQEGYHY